MSGSGDGGCGGRRCLGDRGCRGFGGEVGLGGGEKAWGGRDWGAASSPGVFDVQFLTRVRVLHSAVTVSYLAGAL